MAADHVAHRSDVTYRARVTHRMHAAMNRRGALTMNRRGVFTMHRLCVLRMHRRVARSVRSADEVAEIQSVVVCNLPPAFAAVEFADDCVEALSRLGSQQVRFL